MATHSSILAWTIPSLRRRRGQGPHLAKRWEPRGFSRVAAAFSSYDGDLSLPLGLALGPSGSVGKESASSAGDPGSISGSGPSLGEENGSPWTWNNRLVPNRKRNMSRLYIVTLLI